jgi:penicillin amidase
MKSRHLLSLSVLVVLVACGGDDRVATIFPSSGVSGPSGPSGPTAPTEIEDLLIAATPRLDGLSAPVDVVTDRRGFPHIYAATPEDAVRVQGYLMARDRMAQMEMLRRATQGRLAEVLGSSLPSTVEDDIAARVLGLHRQAQAMYDDLDAGSEEKRLLDAFAGGVTARITEIRNGEASLPGPVPMLLTRAALTDWTGVDSLTLARYQSYSLSFSANEEIDATLAAQTIAAIFPAGHTDPVLASRAGLFLDFWPLAPAVEATTVEGFYQLGTKSRVPRAAPQARRLSRTVGELAREAAPFLRSTQHLIDLFAGQDRGSNNWVVSGALTASGNAILANDPHLSLTSPSVWWMCHLNTTRAGGDWDVMGVSFAGIPSVVLGFNRKVAWGATVTTYDVTDVYQEVISDGGSGPDTVLFDGEQVPIETITETINIAGGATYDLDIEVVPHHGPIIPGTKEAGAALSWRWTGLEVSHELRAFLGMVTAQNVDDVLESMLDFEVGSQNIVAADASGNIAWTTQSYVPARDPRALSWDPETMSGANPAMILGGSGEYEWTGRLAPADIPNAKNPAQGWLATANQDQTGTSHDGNPFNDEKYLSAGYAIGHRQARIVERMTALATEGGITPQEMSALQAESKSPLGTLLTGSLVAAVARAEEEAASPGTHDDLADAVADADMTTLGAMRDALVAWSFETPAAVEGMPDAATIEDSVATTVFNVTITNLVNLAFSDEVEAIGVNPGTSMTAKTLQLSLLSPERMATYDAAIGDTVLWDNIGTAEMESRDERIIRAMTAAAGWLEQELGADMDGWRWGYLHTVRFRDLLGLSRVSPTLDRFSIPRTNDPDFPDGFPRHGDNFVVDASHFGLWNSTSYSYGHGPSQRLVVELTPDGPRAFNALPGGQVHEADDPHHADEAEYWRANEAPALAFDEVDVVGAAEKRERFVR